MGRLSERQRACLKMLDEQDRLGCYPSVVGRRLAHLGLGKRGRNLTLGGMATLNALERCGFARSVLKLDDTCGSRWVYLITDEGRQALKEE